MLAHTQWWLVLYTLSGFVVLLLAVSTLFSLGGWLLRPWFDKQERMLHALPTEQYLTVFAWPIAQVVVFAVITGLGVTLLLTGGLTTLTGIAVLVVAAGGGIYAGLRGAWQLYEARRKDPIELACFDKPAAMRWAMAELTRSAKALWADASTTDVNRLRFEHQKLHQLHDRLNGLLKEPRQPEPGQQRLVVWSRELASGYTGLVSLGALTAVILAVGATGARIVAGGGVVRAVGLGAVLTVSAVGLWWVGMRLRARTHAKRTEAFRKELTEELEVVRCTLDKVDQCIRDEVSQLAGDNERGASPPGRVARRDVAVPGRRRGRRHRR